MSMINVNSLGFEYRASEAMWTPRVSMENSVIPDVSSKVLTEGQWDEIQRNHHWHQLDLYLETEVAK